MYTVGDVEGEGLRYDIHFAALQVAEEILGR
jgi:hypothetical protein